MPVGSRVAVLDFCYFCNASCLAQLAISMSHPASLHESLVVMNFLHATGPLAMAIPMWRNSLVFHSLDKITSVFIHSLPPLFVFALRWYPPAAGLQLPATLPLGRSMFLGLSGYAAWQALYLLATEVFFARRIVSNELMSSIRWLTTPGRSMSPPGCYTGITHSTYKVVSRLGWMRKGELFDPDAWKTKSIFVLVQLLYTAATLLVSVFLWSSYEAHLLYLFAISISCVWNGASYYIEVFSKAYQKQFEGDAAARRDAVRESYGVAQENADGSKED